MSWFPIPRNIPHAVVITKQTHDEFYSRIKRLEAEIAQAVSALELARDSMLDRGVPTDPEHPHRVALNQVEAVLAKANGEGV